METVLITGASRGIGLELVKQFSASNYSVIATYRGKPSAQLQSLADHQNIKLIELEVTDSKSIIELQSALDGQTVDVLVNNAGVKGADEQDFLTLDTQDWLNTLAINTISPLEITRALLKNLQKSHRPRVVAISSQMGALTRQSPGFIGYRTSKAALNKALQVMALELSDQGIIVCPVHPGWVKTDMGGQDAEITVDESAIGIKALIESLTQENSGQFFNWNGSIHPW